MKSNSYHFGFLSLIIAVMLNLAGIFFLNLLILPSTINELTHTAPIKAKLKKIRQLGVKKSKKKNFSPPVGKLHKSPPPKPVTQATRPIQKLEPMNEIKKKRKEKGNRPSQKMPNLKVSRKKAQLNKRLKDQAYQKKQPFGLIDDVLLKSDFIMKPEIPNGVPKDELNSIEKMYFSFQKRMYLQYVNTFITTYNQLKKEQPLVKRDLQNNRHRLTARVTFDIEGNIISIKIIKSSLSDDVHDLFEQTLRNLLKVPNPPKDFINKRRQFVIYYVLQVN